MSIKLTELISHLGDEKVKFQLLDTSIVSMKKKREYNEFAFATDQGFGFETDQLGIVVWLNRDEVSDFMEFKKQKKKEEDEKNGK